MRRLAMCVSLASALGSSGCVERDAGVVELAWVFVDRNGDPIFPGGVFSIDAQRDSCGLPGTTSNGSTSYDLQVQVEMCDPDCAAGCDDASCLVMDPLVFPCDASRGSEREVPASDEPYRFTLRAAIRPTSGGECLDPNPDCIAVPGPRERRVRAGLVTDLQVYQISVDVSDDNAPLDLEACGCA